MLHTLLWLGFAFLAAGVVLAVLGRWQDDPTSGRKASLPFDDLPERIAEHLDESDYLVSENPPARPHRMP